jgi:hypothetical protein
MKIHTVITQANGIISVQLQATFVGDSTDATDRALIAAFGDPQVNVAGSFTDPNNLAFTFQMPTSEKFVGVTQLTTLSARFMLALPAGSNPNQPAPIQGPLDVVTPNPSEAAQAWAAIVTNRVRQAMQSLRSQILVPTIGDVTI